MIFECLHDPGEQPPVFGCDNIESPGHFASLRGRMKTAEAPFSGCSLKPKSPSNIIRGHPESIRIAQGTKADRVKCIEPSLPAPNRGAPHSPGKPPTQARECWLPS